MFRILGNCRSLRNGKTEEEGDVMSNARVEKPESDACAGGGEEGRKTGEGEKKGGGAIKDGMKARCKGKEIVSDERGSGRERREST